MLRVPCRPPLCRLIGQHIVGANSERGQPRYVRRVMADDEPPRSASEVSAGDLIHAVVRATLTFQGAFSLFSVLGFAGAALVPTSAVLGRVVLGVFAVGSVYWWFTRVAGVLEFRRRFPGVGY